MSIFRRTPMDNLAEAARTHTTAAKTRTPKADAHVEPSGDATPQSWAEAVEAYSKGIITSKQLREAWKMQPVGTSEPGAIVHGGRPAGGPPITLCGIDRTEESVATTFDISLVNCSDCRIAHSARGGARRITPATGFPTVAPSVSGGSGMSWTDPKYEDSDWPVVEERIGADRLDPEIKGKIDMIETIDEHLTTTVERVDELSEQLRDLKEALEDRQEAPAEPAAPSAPSAPSTAPEPSSDLREDILAVLEEFGHDPEVAAEILAERFKDADVPPAERISPPERFPAIVKVTADAMGTENFLVVCEAIERGDYEVQPNGDLRVTYPIDGEVSDWMFSDQGWRWADARTSPEVDLDALAEEMWRANLETLGSERCPLANVSPKMQERYRDMAERITTTMQDPDRTFLR